MPPKAKKPAARIAARSWTAAEVVALLEQRSTRRDLDNLKRFGIAATRPLGVSMANIQAVARQVGRDHELANRLWKTNVYEARMLTAFVDEPERVTAAQMDRWCEDFDNWGICDTLCFKLFDQSPHAWSRVKSWSTRREEFVKRAAFALLASLALHDKRSPDAPFLASLRLIQRAAADERNFVKKGVLWALRGVGTRNSKLKAAAVKLSRELAESSEPAAKWIGRTAMREMSKPAGAGKRSDR
ncbi:MAG: DNA alkylation repair protein [Candidatus Eisenbacteria bacterium]|uniref:DNA alkylation repair protein n=1 Tax=Eiseniibacteriota bacterium TaxID=2212470 RepID=A0A849SKE3_UNCEI|nr:DNA alkylation repair protein [Candidatus Eisenbacteria bacterium]